MDDLIKRQDAIKIVSGDGKYFGLVARSVLHKMWKDVCSLPSAQQWTPCSEGLPKEGVRIIVQYGDGSLGIIERVRLKIWNLTNSPYAKVVAWMPAPEPYKAESEK